jgi:hypothetical protein
MLWINALVVLVTATLELTGHSLAVYLYKCQWGEGITLRVFLSYYLLFYVVPILSFVALLTNKEKPVKPIQGVKIFPDNPV